MIILHLITPSSRMMKTYVDAIQQAFPDDEHLFYTTRHVPKSEENFFDADNMLHMDGNSRLEKMKHFKRQCKSADAIVWHGFLFPFRMMLYLYANRWILKKSIWVMWGIDLYNWKIPSHTPRAIFMNHVNAVCRKKVRAAVALLDPDKEVYEGMFRGKTPCYVAPYPISVRSFEMMEERRGSRERRSGRVNIQIGNNAHSFNNHNRVLDDLVLLDRDSTQYYFPLSYGGVEDWKGNRADYKKRLIERAIGAYGERAHFLQKMMPQDEYTNYLWGIDIAIFDADRQNALGNILKLLYMGSKVFLSPENPLYDFFISKGVVVYNARDIAHMSKKEFYSTKETLNAVEWITDTYYPSNAIRPWGPLFDLFRAGKSVAAAPVEGGESVEISNHFKYKPDYLAVSPYVSSRRKLPSDWHFAVLVGDDIGLVSVAQSVLESEPRWFLCGSIDGKEEHSLCEAHAALGYYASSEEVSMLPDRVAVVLAFSDGSERRQWLEGHYAPAVSEEKDDGVSFVSSRSSIGFGVVMGRCCTVTSGSRIMPGCQLGDGVLVDAAHVGSNCKLGDYSTIQPGAICGAYCVLGNNVTICSGVVLPAGTTVADDSVVDIESVNG